MDILYSFFIPDIVSIVLTYLPKTQLLNYQQTKFPDMYSHSYWGTGRFHMKNDYFNTREEQEIFNNRNTFAQFHKLIKFKYPSTRDLVAIGLYKKDFNYSWNHMFVERKDIGREH